MTVTSRMFLGAAALALLAGSALAQTATPINSKTNARSNDRVRAPLTQTTDATPGERGLAPVAFWLHVLHNSDGESQIVNAGSGVENFGGAARFATVVSNLKAFAPTYPADATPKGLVFISSGDNFIPSPEFNANLDLPLAAPFYDTVLINALGYDALTIGNHEFDFGPDTLARFLEGFSNPAPKFITSNLDFNGEPRLQAQVASGRIVKSHIAITSGEKIGIIGATTESLPFISTPRGVIVNPVLPAIQAEVTRLRTVEGVNKIILSTHLQGLTSEVALIPFLTDVDIVIAGGGGELLANPGTLLVPGDSIFSTNIGGTGYPRVINDAVGKPVRVIGTRGDYRYVGRLVVGFDAAGEIVAVDSISNPVRVSGVAPDAVLPDAFVQTNVVNPVAASVASLGANIIAIAQQPLDGRSASIRSIETNLGNIVADSLLHAATVVAERDGLPIPHVALQNGGGIRNNNILPAGNFSELDTFSVAPFANFVAIVPNISPQQFKDLLENAVMNVAGTPGGGANNGRFAQIAGFRMEWDPTGLRPTYVGTTTNILTRGTRVREVVLNDGTVIVRNGSVVPGAPNINIATIDFLARGGDQFPFNGAPFINVGKSYQQALENYVRLELGGLISLQQYPASGEGRIIRR